VPQTRPLKVFAFDPSLGRQYGNVMTVGVDQEDLKAGPRGRLLEVIDYDVSNDCYYPPVDLDARKVLLQGGLTPSENDPQFHQQMVYAVASRTIEHFELALGRKVRWSRKRKGSTRDRGRPLRIFPHAMQDANAYYDPRQHALLFGYFAASEKEAGSSLPGQTVYTCLSHDIIAHETTHALIHDIRSHFMEATGEDTLAFHEAFADIVALFQHFTFKDALLDHIQRTGGVLYRALTPTVATRGATPAIGAEEPGKNMLVGLAQQFGEAMGMRAALRSALGSPRDSQELGRLFEPHQRGAILVAAVFDAFFSAYSRRMADLLRIARPGGMGQTAELGLELADRLAGEAAKTAGHFLNMCVRALDYCPPVDITFGDFLRAVITADMDLVSDDDRGYRQDLIDAFRARGIRPGEALSYSEEALRWDAPPQASRGKMKCAGLRFDVMHETSPAELTANARLLHAFGERYGVPFHLKKGRKIEVASFHPVARVSPDGQLKFQVVAELLQQEEEPLYPERRKPTFVHRGGITLVLNGEDGSVRYAIYKRLASKSRKKAQQEFWHRWRATSADAYHDDDEPLRADLARIHRGWGY
jgi:hypothetical protein